MSFFGWVYSSPQESPSLIFNVLEGFPGDFERCKLKQENVKVQLCAAPVLLLSPFATLPSRSLYCCAENQGGVMLLSVQWYVASKPVTCTQSLSLKVHSSFLKGRVQLAELTQGRSNHLLAYHLIKDMFPRRKPDLSFHRKGVCKA